MSDKDNCRSTLAEVIPSVLEESVFAFLDQSEGEPIWNGDVIEASLPFDGDFSGTVHLACSEATALEWTSSMLGMDTDDVDSEDMWKNTVSELLNIACGVFLEQWLGGDTLWHIGLPVVQKVSSERYMKELPSTEYAIVFEDEENGRVDSFVCLNE